MCLQFCQKWVLKFRSQHLRDLPSCWPVEVQQITFTINIPVSGTRYFSKKLYGQVSSNKLLVSGPMATTAGI